ncbi:MAG: DNA mismatch repair endonuclease MutL, partial [Anaerolineaceae bacterium]|nr:DNA mismatch repair endonuclease MutL [Anaerolineaceae bacterium]
ELPLAVTRHATSKLEKAEDLFHIATLGFRGEALASIGSVSRLTITTCPPGEQTGARLVVDAGQIFPVEQTSAAPGTVVRVEDLFLNVPARLKFLKKDTTERTQITGLVTRYALAYPTVRFKLTSDGAPTLQTSGSGDRREILSNLYGLDTARQMLEVVAVEEDISLSGYISPLTITRSNRREITFFINGRWVQDVPLVAALIQAYHTLIMVGRYPMATIFINLQPEEVDVNVHPAKSEVRFRQPDRIFSAVQRSVRRALLAYTPVAQVEPGRSWWSAATTPARTLDPAWDMSAETPPVKPVGQPMTSASQPDLPGRLPLLRLVGQVGAAYLVAEGPDGLYLIDQHAAHERVLFERLMHQQQSNQVISQALLQPVTLELKPESSTLLADNLGILNRFGFQVEKFGQNAFLIRSLPALLADTDPQAALQALVEDFEEDEEPLKNELEARLIARICKRAAVKAGKILSPAEQTALVEGLEACHSPRTCPHGRPTMIHLSADLLERQFGRRGAR